MGKNVIIFSLPPLVTCTPTEWCKKNCYACKGRFFFSNVQKSLNYKYRESKKDNFVSRVNLELSRTRKRFVRIHVSGDFYNTDYVNKWKRIALANPDKLFRAFTKRMDLIDSLLELNALPNVNIYESIDETKPKQDSQLLFGAIEGTPVVRELPWEARMCNMGCEECGHLCWTDPKNVFFHKH